MLVGALVLPLLLVVAPDASPSPAEPHHFGGQRSVGIIADAGFYSGVAAGVQLGTAQYGLHGTFGWLPVLVSAIERGPSSTRSTLKLFSTIQAGADLYALPFRTSAVADIGGSVGYRYNDLLGHGVGFAFQARVDLDATFAIHVIGGLTVYPDGRDRVVRETAGLASADFLFGSSFNIAANLGLLIFP